jgi:hypothetical protein
MSFSPSVRARLCVAGVFAFVVAGCPSGEDVAPSDSADGGGEDGGPVLDEGGTSTQDSAPPPPPPPPPCSRLTTPLCSNGEKCAGAPDCVSKICLAGICVASAPADGLKNGDETDLDCGGSKAPACADGKACLVKSDCMSGVCTTKICQVPTKTDGVKNGNETGIDCGGTSTGAPKCAAGQGCLTNVDCDNIKCDTVQKKCLVAAHNDGIRNLDETGVDCGGPTATVMRCPTGQGCALTSDCANVLCTPGVLTCAAPSAIDNLKNGSETDIDCGGGAPTNAKRCPDDLICAADGDCASAVCNSALRCVAGRSCKAAATSGIVTCGKRETGDATKVHESCCRSLPLPVTTTVRLDKYEVTAGRFRQFVETVGPNLRKWAADEVAAATPTGTRLAADIPASMRVLLPASATPGEPLNLVMQIGATVMDSRTPSMSQGCYQDATSDVSGAYGANTYYWDLVTLKAHFGNTIAARRFTKAQYDEKPMNCGTYWMYAAFCAWDGGRMPTQAEVDEAWGTNDYPWGTTFGFPVSPGGGAYQYEATVNYFNSRNDATNPGLFYHFPGYGDAYDLSGYIAAPGRFILDKTTKTSANGESWLDLGANVMELVKSPASGGANFCDFSIVNGPGDVPNLAKCSDGGVAGVERAVNLPNVGWVGGSWEGHRNFTVTGAQPWFTRNSYTLNAQTQYGKTGVRCAR